MRYMQQAPRFILPFRKLPLLGFETSAPSSATMTETETVVKLVKDGMTCSCSKSMEAKVVVEVDHIPRRHISGKTRAVEAKLAPAVV